ncbi:MAG: NAD(P)-dependent oxidoreductase [Acidimicrobiia bacterium]
MKILFTGATGVIGRQALPMLIEEGHDVTAVSRSESDRDWIDSLGARPAQVNLFEADAVSGAMSGIDTVVHYATTIPPQSRMTKRESWHMNDRLRSEATTNLVDAAIAAGASRFIQQSITFFYADGNDEWLTEDSPIDPVWDVLDSALTAERHVDRFRSSGGNGVVLRLGRLYGPGSASAEYIQSVRNRKMPVVGNGANFVSSLHTHDAGSALVAAMTAPDGTFNIADDAPMRSIDFIEGLASMIGAKTPRKYPAWVGKLVAGKASGLLTISHRVSNSAYRSATGWAPKYPSVAEGWASVVAENGAE